MRTPSLYRHSNGFHHFSSTFLLNLWLSSFSATYRSVKVTARVFNGRHLKDILQAAFIEDIRGKKAHCIMKTILANMPR